jgi:hypothetical protein
MPMRSNGTKNRASPDELSDEGAGQVTTPTDSMRHTLPNLLTIWCAETWLTFLCMQLLWSLREAQPDDGTWPGTICNESFEDDEWSPSSNGKRHCLFSITQPLVQNHRKGHQDQSLADTLQSISLPFKTCKKMYARPWVRQ